MLETLTRPNPRTTAAGVALLRVVGLVFVVHGLQKLVQFTIHGPGALALALDDRFAQRPTTRDHAATSPVGTGA